MKYVAYSPMVEAQRSWVWRNKQNLRWSTVSAAAVTLTVGYSVERGEQNKIALHTHTYTHTHNVIDRGLMETEGKSGFQHVG